MPRSSRGSRRATTWAVAQQPRPVPRVVRLGRPANDNLQRPGAVTRGLLAVLAAAVVMLALYAWRVI